MKKRTKPVIPGKKKAALILAKIRIHKYKNRYATLWEAAADFIKTTEFRKIAKAVKKDKYETFMKNRKAQIKFVVNMYRGLPRTENIKHGGTEPDTDINYLSHWPKALYQTKETEFTPPKDIINWVNKNSKKKN